MKHRVVLIANHDLVIYNFRRELVERLLHDGYEVHLIMPDGPKADMLVEMGCVLHEMKVDRHGTNPVTDLKLLMCYRKMLKQIRPVIAFTYTIKPNIYGGMACAMLKIPYAVNITGLGTAMENPGMMQKVTVCLYKLALRRVQRIFFQNTENMHFFEKYHLENGKGKLLPGSGVNLEQFTVIPYPENDTTEFAFISRIMKEKGIDQYLEMAQRIKQKHENTVFHVCGFCEQDYVEKLDELQKKGIIVYHGMVSDVREIFKKIHCTVHPTYYPEGVSNVLLESCASGRPIITTNRSGCREVVDEGKNGYVVEQKNSEDLIDKIEKFIRLSREEKVSMASEGRKKVEAEFDRNIVVSAYMEELKMVL